MEYNFIFGFSLVITALPFLGFPQIIDDTVYFFFGLAIAALSYRMRRKCQTTLPVSKSATTSDQTPFSPVVNTDQTNHTDVV